ncbi:hypothetical protein QJQ45_011830 [Haematococcus lacustris]|nr:hypothetical protein QJQ45_011830 [Haematococcus lacustris]
MTKYFEEEAHRPPFSTNQEPAARQALVQQLHLLKTDLFMQLVESGAMPLRPGVKRLIGEAVAAGVPVAVCSTSNERAVSTIVRVMLGEDIASRMRVFAGDIVPRKKPDPAIYLLAAEALGVDPARCCVIEDSHMGCVAARAAGMKVFITKSSYTQGEDFTGAELVLDNLGEAGDPAALHLEQLAMALAG